MLYTLFIGKTLTLKSGDNIFTEAGNVVNDIKISENRYVNEIIEYDYITILPCSCFNSCLSLNKILTGHKGRLILKNHTEVDNFYIFDICNDISKLKKTSTKELIE